MSKPIANRIKAGARTSEFFKTYVCLPPAQCEYKLSTAGNDRCISVSNTGTMANAKQSAVSTNDIAPVERGYPISVMRLSA